MQYSVGYKIDEQCVDEEDYVCLIASFETLDNAELFIKNCIPKQNQFRFFITVNNYRFYPISHKFEEIS